MVRQVILFSLTLALFLGWSAVAHSGEGGVHKTTARVRIASEECNGECHINYETLNTKSFIRLLCGMDEDEKIPKGFTLATFIACQEFPDAMISVWDTENEQHICNDLDLDVISGAFEESTEDRGKAELLFGSDEEIPLLITARAKYGPLPRRFEEDEICWKSYKTRSIAGALDETIVILEGQLRAGSVTSLYFD
jgi:hypothetical protein